MMRLSTMMRVDAAIRDDGSSSVAEQILERWAQDRGSARFFRSSANFIYRFREQDRARFLRFADASERSRDTVESEIAVVAALAAAGILVAAPVASENGNAVETVATAWGTFRAVVFPALEGEQREFDELDESGFQEWGAALGRLHAMTSGLTGLPERPWWRDHLDFVQGYLPANSPGLRAEYDDIAATLAALPTSQDTYGLAHCDFELDNLIWGQTGIEILDFDDCSRLWYAGDVALALRDLFETGADTSDRRFRTFVNGYREYHPLSAENIAQMPLFMRYARLVMYARLARSLDLTPGDEYPDWLRELSSKMQDRMAEYRASIETQHR